MYEEWARGDFSRTDIFDPDIEQRGYGWPEVRATRGLEGLSSHMTGWLESWERPFVIKADEFIEAGDRIAVLIRWQGRGKGSGMALESEGAHLWTFRDGKAVRYEVYRSREDALATLGKPAGDADR